MKTLRLPVSLSVLAVAMLASLGAATAPAATCVASVVATGSATGVSAQGATLGGSVNPRGCATTYHFQYGVSTTYGAATAPKSAGAGTTDVSVMQPVTGLLPNMTYHFRIVATSSGGTSLGADRTFTTGALCGAGAPHPVAGTGAATLVSARGATLAGSVNPKGCATTYHFQYGVSTTYGAVTAPRSAGAGTTDVSVMQPVTGLLPNTTYHFRLVATSSAGTTLGADRTFTTTALCVGSASHPIVATGVAALLSARGATLRGVVNPNGCATTYHFQYGLTAAYGGVTAARSAGSGTSAMAVVQPVTGLVPNTVYHFRIVAASSAGTSLGADKTFRTSRVCLGGVAPPVAVTGTATGLSARGATLRGAVNPKSCATTYHFQYGPAVAYGAVTAPGSAGSGTGVVSVAQPVTRLAPNTVYHFRIVATSAGGTRVGRDMKLKTAAAPALSFVSIVGTRASVKRGFVARIRLRCVGTAHACQGTLKIVRAHRLIGRRHFVLAANGTRVLSVKLNARGRRLMRQHRRLRVSVAAISTDNTALKPMTLVRRFPAH